MSLSKITLLAAALAFALPAATVATKTFAQAQNNPGNMLSDVGEDEVILISPKGKVMKTKITKGKGGFAKMQKMGAREISGAMIVRRGGKFYLLEDKPGAGSIKSSFQDEFDTGSF
jgi:hypothetical protein